MARLTIFHPEIDGGRGRVIELAEGPVDIGRDPACGVPLSVRGVSRRHARLGRSPYGWLLTDLGSANGTYAGGRRVRAHVVADGEEIQVGDVRIVLSLAGDAPAADGLAPPRAGSSYGLAEPPPLAAPPVPPVPAALPPPVPPPPARGLGVRPEEPPVPRHRAWIPVAVATVAVFVGAALILAWQLLQIPRVRDVFASRSAGDSAGTSAAAQVSDATTVPVSSADPEASWPSPIEPGARQEVEQAVAGVEGAFRKGNLDAVSGSLHPAVSQEYGEAFAAHASELPRVADLLATRRLVRLTPGWAEYEVTERGETYRVTFEKVKGKWVLSSL